MKKLAILGGEPIIKGENPEIVKEMLTWPIITKEDEEAVLDVVRNNKFSETKITQEFEKEFAQWIGADYAVAYTSGTMSLAAALFAAGLGKGDEIICPTVTYWASITAAAGLGAIPVFCNVKEDMSIDPDDLERVISPKTKAIMVVHYCAYPADMDRIMEIAKKHNLLVIEDVSHAQGGLYKGKRLGTIGDIAGMSLMSQKSFAAGELGIVVTNNRRMYERALAYGHYERNNENYITECEDLKPYFNISIGGVKGRPNQVSTAMARVQLKYYDERCEEIRKAMNYFWDLLEGKPGVRPIRVDESTGSNMAGYYASKGLYIAEELHGLPINVFIDALNAELGGNQKWPLFAHGANYCLHTHNLFKTFDLINSGEPSRTYGAERDVRKLDEALKLSEERRKNVFAVPYLVKYNKEWIEKFAQALINVIENHMDLVENYKLNEEDAGGQWFGRVNRS